MAKKKADAVSATTERAAEAKKPTARKAPAKKSADVKAPAAEAKKPTRKAAKPMAEAKKTTTEPKKATRTRRAEAAAPAPAPAPAKATKSKSPKMKAPKVEAVAEAAAPEASPRKKSRKKSAEGKAGAADAEAALRRIHALADQVNGLVERAVGRVDQQAREFEARLEEHLASARRRSDEVQSELAAALDALDAVTRRHQAAAERVASAPRPDYHTDAEEPEVLDVSLTNPVG